MHTTSGVDSRSSQSHPIKRRVRIAARRLYLSTGRSCKSSKCQVTKAQMLLSHLIFDLPKQSTEMWIRLLFSWFNRNEVVERPCCIKTPTHLSPGIPTQSETPVTLHGRGTAHTLSMLTPGHMPSDGSAGKACTVYIQPLFFKKRYNMAWPVWLSWSIIL